MLLSLGCTRPVALNYTPENTVRNFIDAGIKEDKEVFKELIDLEQDEDAFVETYIQFYAEHAKENELKIEDVKIREIPGDELQDWALPGIEEEQGFKPVLVEVTDFDEMPLLYLLEEVDKKYFIKNIDLKESYMDLFK